jgi:trans-feruloyl-CoA hydratase/vanillin synthase
MFDSQYQMVKTDFEDGVLRVTLNRPDKKNAMNPTLHEEMREVMAEAKEEAQNPKGDLRVMVLTGAGDSFCAGQDLEETFLDAADNPYQKYVNSERSWEWGRNLRMFPAPTIAAVNGWCFGGGFRLMCSCDIAIASENARFGLSEVNFGILPAGGTTKISSSKLSERDFLYLSLTGDDISAEEADKMRLVNWTVPHDELYDEVDEIVEKITDLNPLAVRFAKQVYLSEQEGMTTDTARDYEIAKNLQLRNLTNQEDMKAIQAFGEDRFRPGLGTYSEEDIEEFEE